MAKVALSLTGREDLSASEVIREDVFLSYNRFLCKVNIPLWLQNICLSLQGLTLFSIRNIQFSYTVASSFMVGIFWAQKPPILQILSLLFLSLLHFFPGLDVIIFSVRPFWLKFNLEESEIALEKLAGLVRKLSGG